jgi:uncharacterized membrane protein YhaH (DUF805 family)
MRILNEFSPSGRLTRMGFWLRHVTLVPLALWLSISAAQVLGSPADLPFAMLTLVLLVSVWARRLHDRGRSAWWLLVVFVPVIGALGLAIECALRGSSVRGDRFDPSSTPRADYLTVQSSSQPSTAP